MVLAREKNRWSWPEKKTGVLARKTNKQKTGGLGHRKKQVVLAREKKRWSWPEKKKKGGLGQRKKKKGSLGQRKKQVVLDREGKKKVVLVRGKKKWVVLAREKNRWSWTEKKTGVFARKKKKKGGLGQRKKQVYRLCAHMCIPMCICVNRVCHSAFAISDQAFISWRKRDMVYDQ